jgi:hypothetical protein
MQKSGMAQVTTEKDLQMCAVRIPLPLPMDLQVTAASAAGYLFIASSPALVRQALEVRDGRQAGLLQSEGFKELLKYLPAEGNQFSYVDARFSRTIQGVQRAVLSMGNNPIGKNDFIRELLLKQKPAFGLSISAHAATGWQSVSVGNQDSATALVAAPAVGMTAMLSAMVLPALAKAKGKAQSIQCMNNMKQINLAFRIWANDRADKYPFELSAADGGTKDFCDRDSNGFDRASVRHFAVMAEELSTPRILVCPSDKGKTAATSFSDLSADNVSYRVRSEVKLSDMNDTVIKCPVHHHVGRVDGSVTTGAASLSRPL